MNSASYKNIAQNRRALHDYIVDRKIEVGIVLRGTEVKSLRAGKLHFQDAWVDVNPDFEVFCYNLHISPYEFGNIYNHNPDRPKKLLLKKREIKTLHGELKTKGKTCIPLAIFLKGNVVKLSIAIARGKKKFDKREAAKKKDADLEIKRTLRQEEKG